MTTIASDVINGQMDSILRNPKTAVRVAFDLLERLSDGEVVMVDASNPFAYSIEMGAVMTHYGLVQSETLARRLYPSMARSQEDLYLHMADEDYLDRFATPAETVIGFVMPLDEIYGRAVPLNDGTGAKALVIPRHTSVTTGDVTFTLQYPIVIKVMYNNTISIYMDVTNKAPTYVPVSNILNWSKSQIEMNDWVVIDAPVQQVKIISQTIQLTSFTGYSKTFTFDDNFYYARAYIPDTSGKWKEITVTHQQQVYNANKATVCLKVFNSSVQMYIPQIYFQNGLITSTIRLDIYTTKGKMEQDLSANQISTFKIKYADFDNPLTDYSTPFAKFTNVSAMTRTLVSGGSSALSFAELLRRVTSRSTFTEGLPITDSQMGSMLKKEGFDLITTLDNVTSRQYCASRDLDPPSNQTTITGVGCSIQTVGLKIDDLKVNPIIFESTRRATIHPRMLFLQDHGGLHVVDDASQTELTTIAAASPDGIANIVNSNQYYYTPFHYILDMSLNTFNVRPYYMTSPTVMARYVFQQNDGLGLSIRSAKYGVQYLPDGSGYMLVLTLEENASINSFTADRISLQLSYLVPDSASRGWIKGRLITPIEPTTGKPQNNVWAFAFDIESNFDINNQHLLDIANTGYPVALEQEFDILMVVKDFLPEQASLGDIDTIVSKAAITDYDYMSTYIGVTQEKIVIKFGEYLEHLWRRTRTVVADTDYRRYENDVPEYWKQDVYETDASGNIKIEYDYETSQIKTNLIHRKGDPILDPSGMPVYRHLKGDIMLDQNSQPIPMKNDMELERYVDIFLVDGRYYFANNESTTTYLEESLQKIARWITQDVKNMSRRCLERTDIYFYPKSSTGMVDVIVGDGTMTRLKADQSLQVVYTLRKEKFKNAEIRENLTKVTPSILSQALKTLQRSSGGVLTKNDILSLVKELLKDDIVDIEIKGFLDDQYPAVLLSDVSSTPTIGKKLVTMSNLTLQVQDDVEVDFNVLDKDVIGGYTLKR